MKKELANMTRIAAALALVISCGGGSTTTPPSLSSDTTLTSLSPSIGTLSPAFSSDTRQYTLTVPYGTGAVRLTPVAHDAHALSVAVGQDKLALFAIESGAPSAALAVPAFGASSKVTVRVTAQDGADGDYVVTLAQSAKLSADATLSSLSPSQGTLTPPFDPSLYTYVLSVPNGTDSLSVTAAQHDAAAQSVTVTQDSAAVDGPLAIPAVGVTSLVDVQVTAQDGTVATYAITLTQAPPIPPAAFTIYAIGDSTMADYNPAQYPDQAGWGQMFRNFLVGTEAAYVNAAHNGRSSRSFYDEGSWGAVKSQLKPGDYVFIQWAHNDESDNGLDGTETPVVIGTAPFGTYQTYLGKYVDETRAAGATPIFFTPVVRRYFDNAGVSITAKGQHDLTGQGAAGTEGQDLNYVEAMKQVATNKSVPVIDMTASTKALVEQYGPTQSKSVIYIAADDTHLQPLGATMFAQLAAQGLVAQNILSDYLNPAGDLIVSPSSLDFGSIYAGSTSATPKTVSITGLALGTDSGNVTVNAPSGFGISLTSGGTYGASLSLPFSGGRLAPTTVYVQFAPTAAQTYGGNLAITPPAGAAKTVALSGVGLPVTTGGTDSTAFYALTADFTCVTTGFASCTNETYVGLTDGTAGNGPPTFGQPGSANNPAAWVGNDTPATTTVEKAQIAGGTWPGSEIGPADGRYIQFAVAPANGKSWTIDQVTMWLGSGGGKNMGWAVEYSKSASFAASEGTVLPTASNGLQNNMIWQTLQLASPLTVASGETLYLRVYPWYGGTATATGKSLLVQSVTVHGTAQ